MKSLWPSLLFGVLGTVAAVWLYDGTFGSIVLGIVAGSLCSVSIWFLCESALIFREAKPPRAYLIGWVIAVIACVIYLVVSGETPPSTKADAVFQITQTLVFGFFVGGIAFLYNGGR